MITVLGASGFIGSHVVRHLERSAIEFQAPSRDARLSALHLGDVIYCIGLTADFRARPLDAVDAHVSKLVEVIRDGSLDTLTYLSSARLYLRSSSPAHEEDALQFNPLEFEDLYNLSKAMGESIVLSLGAKGRVARPSNVYGAGQKATFLAALIESAQRTDRIDLESSLDSAKDYVSVDDVAEMLVKITLEGRERIYNIASGESISHRSLTEEIVRLTGCSVTVKPGATTTRFPAIDISRLRDEFGFRPKALLPLLPSLLQNA